MVIPVGSREDRAREHTLAHALGYDSCYHNAVDVTTCVLCGRWLKPPPREHFDTCGGNCWKRLLKLQRQRDAAMERRTGT